MQLIRPIQLKKKKNDVLYIKSPDGISQFIAHKSVLILLCFINCSERPELLTSF